MNLNTRQIIGLIAAVVFGGILIWQLVQPKRDPFRVPGAIPSTVENQSGLSIDDYQVEGQAPPAIPVPEPRYPLSLGSEDARDDLYCSGLIYAAHRATSDSVTPEAQTRREQVVALAKSGVDQLIAEGVADQTQTAAIADAHSAKAAKDHAEGLPRITLDACQARAVKLPSS